MSICILNFCRYPLSSLRLVIHYFGCLVTSYSLNSEHFFHNIVFEYPVVDWNIPASFAHALLVSSYVVAFVFGYCVICKQTIYCWDIIIQLYAVLLIILNIELTPPFVFHMRHPPGFSYCLLVGHHIPWLRIFTLFFQPHTPFSFITCKGYNPYVLLIHFFVS